MEFKNYYDIPGVGRGASHDEIRKSFPEKRAACDQLGSDHRQGQEFRPSPGWDAGFEFSGQGYLRDEKLKFR